jgi:lipopolysaccharide exporter
MSTDDDPSGLDLAHVRGAKTAFSDFVSVVGGRLGSTLLSVVTVTMTTRILAPSAYGVFAYFAIISTLIFSLTSSWTSSAVVRYGREELETVGHMRAVTWGRWRITWPLIVIVPFVVVMFELAGAFPVGFGWSFVALATSYGLLSILADHVLYVMDAAGEMKRSAIGAISQQSLVVLTVLVMFTTGVSHSPELIAAASTLGLALVTVIFGRRHWRLAFWPPARDIALIHRMRRFSYPMVGFTLSQYLISSVDIFVIRGFLNIGAAGIYAVAYRSYSLLQQSATASGQVLTPLFVSLQRHAREDVIRRYLERIVPQLTLFVSTIVGMAAPFIFWAVPIVFGGRYSAAGLPLVVLLLAAALFWISNLLAPIIVLYERTRIVATVNALAAVANLSVDVLLIGPFGVGIVGAGIATAAALGLITIVYWRTACRYAKAERAAAPLAVAPALVGVGVSMLASGVWRVVAAVTTSLVVALLVQSLARVFTIEDASLIDRLDMPARGRPAARRLVVVLARIRT